MVDPPSAYTPSYYDERVGLSAPEGVYGKELHSNQTPHWPNHDPGPNPVHKPDTYICSDAGPY